MSKRVYRFGTVGGRKVRISESEYQRRQKISKSLKAYHKKARRVKKPPTRKPDLSTATRVQPRGSTLLVSLTKDQAEAIKQSAARRTAKRRRQQLSTFRDSLKSKLRPGDRGKIRFFDSQGRRLGSLEKARRSGKKVWAVKIDKLGRAKILNDPDPATKNISGVKPVPAPSQIRYLDLWKSAKQTPKLYRELLEEINKRLKKSPVASPIVGKTFRHVSRFGDFDGAIIKMYSQFQKLKTATRGHTTWVLAGYAIFKKSDGLKPIPFITAPLRTADYFRYERKSNRWTLTRKNGVELIKDTLFAAIYGPISRELERYGKVSVSSKRRLRPVDGDLDDEEFYALSARMDMPDVTLTQLYWQWKAAL